MFRTRLQVFNGLFNNIRSRRLANVCLQYFHGKIIRFIWGNVFLCRLGEDCL